MGPLSRGIVGENQRVDEAEALLFETQYDIKRLIEQLESKDEGQA